MKNNLNMMVLNGTNLRISKIELDKSDLRITDESCKYCFQVCIEFSWQDINNIKIGEKKEIDFNEYCISENNESALILPSSSYVERISANCICFDLQFKDLSNTIHYMNKRGHFDIELESLEVKVFVDYKKLIV